MKTNVTALRWTNSTDRVHTPSLDLNHGPGLQVAYIISGV